MKSLEIRGAVRVILALSALLPVLGLAASSPPAKTAAAATPAPTRGRPVATLPETTIARVYTGPGTRQYRDISRRQLVVAATRAGSRLDSLTPRERREFLDVLVDQAVLVERVHREPRRWERRDSTDYQQLRDRLVMRAALDSAMNAANSARRARGDSVLPPQELGIQLRDQAVATLAPEWNDAGLERAVAVFDTLPRPNASMSMLEQMRVAGIAPTVGDADAALALVRSPFGVYTLGELVHDFARLNPMYRPRIESVGNVRDVVGNTLFEHVLRKAAADQGLERQPRIAAALAERAEYLDVSRFVAREVYAKLAMDSVTLQRYFDAHRSDFDFDERAQVVSMISPDRAAAEAMARRLTVPGEAESLAAQSARAGTPYATVILHDSDSLLFGRLKRGGIGVVVGPDSTMQGWRTMRLMALEPRRPRTYEQAEPMVQQRWYDHEGERLMRALLDGLRANARVVVNDRALAQPLGTPGPAVSR